MNSSCILPMNNSWFIHGPDGRIFYVNNSWVTHGQSGELPFMGYSWIIHLLSLAFDEQFIYFMNE